MAEVYNSIELELYKNTLTADPNDYMPRGAIEKRLNMDDIVSDIVVSWTDLNAGYYL